MSNGIALCGEWRTTDSAAKTVLDIFLVLNSQDL